MADGRAHHVLAVAITFFALSWTTVLARLWVRTRLISQIGYDDATMVITQLVFTGYLICQIQGVEYGTGQHMADLEPWRAEKAVKFWYFCEVLYALSSLFLKVSIGFFFVRVAVRPAHIWTARTVMVTSVIIDGAFALLLVFQCWPIRSFWTLDPTDGHCVNSNVLRCLTYTISATQVITDWTLGILPIFIVKHLSIPLRQKVMVVAILTFAAIGSTATIVRLPYIAKLTAGSEGDFLYDTAGLAIWSTIEIGVGITASSIATLRPLLRLAQQKLGWRDSLTGYSRHMSPSPCSESPSWQLRSPVPMDDRLKNDSVVTTISSDRARFPIERVQAKESMTFQRPG